jgi:hypothetical protein
MSGYPGVSVDGTGAGAAVEDDGAEVEVDDGVDAGAVDVAALVPPFGAPEATISEANCDDEPPPQDAQQSTTAACAAAIGINERNRLARIVSPCCHTAADRVGNSPSCGLIERDAINASYFSDGDIPRCKNRRSFVLRSMQKVPVSDQEKRKNL